MRILVLESSTTSAKAMLYEVEKGTYQVESVPFLLGQDITKQDPDQVYLETMALGRRVLQGRDVDLIALSGAWHSVFLADEAMRPVTPAYTWSNTEASPLSKRLREDRAFTDWYYQRTGCMVSSVYPAFKLLKWKEQGMDLSRYHISGQGAYNTYRMTGERVSMDALVSGTGLMNIHTKTYDEEVLKMIGIGPHQLERIVTYRDTFPLHSNAAHLLGTVPGIPVMPTGPDGGLNQVGSGAIDTGVMTFSVGTSGALRLSSDRPVIPERPSTWCYLSPKKWLSGGATSGATNCIDWFKKSMFDVEMDYAEIEARFSPGEDVPIFLPFLFGERAPGWMDDRGAGFYDLKPYHTRYDMYRAVMEGVLFNLLQNYEILTRINGLPKKIMLSGGILHSALWTKMCVDLFNAPMTVNQVEHNSLLGGVLLGLELLGVEPTMEERSFSKEEVLLPDPVGHRALRARYERYLHWYALTQTATPR